MSLLSRSCLACAQAVCVDMDTPASPSSDSVSPGALAGGIIGVTSLLAMKASQSTKFGGISKLLP